MTPRRRRDDSEHIDWKKMRHFDVKTFLIGVLAAIVPAIGAAWAFATVAADHVLQPHISQAKARVHLMCMVAEHQNKSIKAVCDAVGADCPTDTLIDLIASCREKDE